MDGYLIRKVRSGTLRDLRHDVLGSEGRACAHRNYGSNCA